MGTRGGRKIHYATLLVDALDVTEVPRPLDRVLAHCGQVAPCDAVVADLPGRLESELRERIVTRSTSR
jgi:hypothetical protein